MSQERAANVKEEPTYIYHQPPRVSHQMTEVQAEKLVNIIMTMTQQVFEILACAEVPEYTEGIGANTESF